MELCSTGSYEGDAMNLDCQILRLISDGLIVI